jgi:phosphatidylserine synthase
VAPGKKHNLVPQFRIKHFAFATVFVAILASLVPVGEFGWSVIPLTFALPISMLARFESFRHRSNELLKFRYHVGVLVFNWTFFFANGIFLTSFGWWRFPFNGLIMVYLLPASILMMQFIKYSDNEEVKTDIRIAQASTIWIILATNVMAALLGRTVL